MSVLWAIDDAFGRDRTWVHEYSNGSIRRIWTTDTARVPELERALTAVDAIFTVQDLHSPLEP